MQSPTGLRGALREVVLIETGSQQLEAIQQRSAFNSRRLPRILKVDKLSAMAQESTSQILLDRSSAV
jgi:hypothetical protein